VLVSVLIDARHRLPADEPGRRPSNMVSESRRLRGDAQRLRLQAAQIRSDVVEIRVNLENAKARRAIGARAPNR
jgi:hypothetical protein